MLGQIRGAHPNILFGLNKKNSKVILGSKNCKVTFGFECKYWHPGFIYCVNDNEGFKSWLRTSI